MSTKIPADITPGIANDNSVVHASDASVANLSRSHTERDISRLQSSVKDYSASQTYAVDDLVFDSNIEYRCITAILVPEPFDPAKWLPIGRGFPGDVIGPASSTANQIAKFLDATGKEITNSVVQIGPLGAMNSVLSINTHPIPAGSDPFVTLDATQTLTNKTLGTNTAFGSTIDADSNDIENIGDFRFATTGPPPSPTDFSVGVAAGAFFLNVPTGGTLILSINGAPGLIGNANVGIAVGGRLQANQGTSVTPASTLTLPNNGNSFEVVAAGTIDFITTTDWSEGAIITLFTDGAGFTVTYTHNAGAPPANTAPLLLFGGNNANLTNNTTLVLQYLNGFWRQIGGILIP